MAGLALAQALLWGCSSAGTPLERAAQITDRALMEGVRQATSPEASQGAVGFVGRYNPCRCEAPPFEIWIYGGWERVALRSEDEALVEALLTQAQAADASAEFRLIGWPERSSPYGELELEGFEPAERTSARGSSTSTP
ncbi:hypothetical protein FRC98_17360 [Lujinxingia vulgaris]|uniref:Uncharacterized protein n=1 Tax=Lujinxingia vulgaris TaxID=2600176 RepID=A0A5C6X4T5_9DELT|nr:hypothetical protein [Lujinxingia vulgaris]TXD35234.1 hypothetical protein FRC98_17360 [Lujinxingia vulgaris]